MSRRKVTMQDLRQRDIAHREMWESTSKIMMQTLGKNATKVRVKLGSYGEHEIPRPVFDYLSELYQEMTSLATRVSGPIGPSGVDMPVLLVGYGQGSPRRKRKRRERVRVKI